MLGPPTSFGIGLEACCWRNTLLEERDVVGVMADVFLLLAVIGIRMPDDNDSLFIYLLVLLSVSLGAVRGCMLHDTINYR